MYGLKIWNPSGELYFTSELDFCCIFAKQQFSTNISTGLGYANTLILPTFPETSASGVELPFTLINIPIGCVLTEAFQQTVVYPTTQTRPVYEVATKNSVNLTALHCASYKVLAPYLEQDDYGIIVKNNSGQVTWSSGAKLVNLIGTVGLGIAPLTELSYYTSEFTIDYDLEPGEDFFFDMGDAVGHRYLPETYQNGVVLHRISSHTFRFYTIVKLNSLSGTDDVYGNAYMMYNTSSNNQIGSGSLNAGHSRKGMSKNIAIFAQKL